MTMFERLVVLLVVTYVIGSINASVFVLRLFSKGDPREWESQNPGTFNVYRQLGWTWAALVFFLDIGRAVGLAIAALLWTSIEYVPIVGLTLVLGNRFPLFHRFRGGKGVAAYLGFTLVIAPIAAAISALIWVLLYRLFRQAFIGSFAMVITLGCGMIVACGNSVASILCVVVTCLIIFHGHRKNIGSWGFR
jgi:acyl phosphate:glycerol-3-phosphate acyltransferase